MSITYTNYVFTTLTYNRDLACKHQRWWSVSRDSNRYIQKVRRRFKPIGPIEYVRVIESHKDWYPHVHLLLHFTGSLRVDNGRYFDRDFFSRLQLCWDQGFSKPEVLRYPDGAFKYVLKYFLKQVRDNNSDDNPGDSSETPPLSPKIWPLKGKVSVWFGLPIRLLAWSRGMQYLYAQNQVRTARQKGFKLEIPTKLVSRKIATHSNSTLPAR